MTLAVTTDRTALAAWSRRIALLSALMITIALVMHRIGRMETPLAIGLTMTAFAGAALALLIGIAAAVVIWRRGAAGAWSTAAGLAVSLAIFAWPLGVVPFYMRSAHLSDVTTDTEHPPEFAILARDRAKSANPVTYRPTNAVVQANRFPEVQPIVLARPTDEVFDAAGEAARRLKWKIVAEEAPEAGGSAGHIEAEDRTLILGFTDDVVVRVENEGTNQTRVDVRSLSRYGSSDFGRNAQRVKDFYAELHARLEASVPSAAGARGKAKARDTKMPVKQRKGAPGQKPGPRTEQAPARPDARRAPPPRATPPSRAGDRARDR